MSIRKLYQIPFINDCMEALDDASIFSTLNANIWYCLVETLDEDLDKKVITYHADNFRFTHMPFRLNNGPGKFQLEKRVLLVSVKGQFALVYFDTGILSWRTNEHIDNVKLIQVSLNELKRAFTLKSASHSITVLITSVMSFTLGELKCRNEMLTP